MQETQQLIPPTHPNGLSKDQIANLCQRADAVAQHAYAPYSNFRVGAAILLDTGDIVVGCNVENASYRLTTCAEQSAIVAAVGQYGPGIKIRAVAVANLNREICQPCGACRQTILEFSTPGTRIFYPAADGAIAEVSMAEILPAAFTFPR